MSGMSITSKRVVLVILILLPMLILLFTPWALDSNFMFQGFLAAGVAGLRNRRLAFLLAIVLPLGMMSAAALSGTVVLGILYLTFLAGCLGISWCSSSVDDGFLCDGWWSVDCPYWWFSFCRHVEEKNTGIVRQGGRELYNCTFHCSRGLRFSGSCPP